MDLLDRGGCGFDRETSRRRRVGFDLSQDIGPAVVSAMVPQILVLSVFLELLLILRVRRQDGSTASKPDGIDRIGSELWIRRGRSGIGKSKGINCAEVLLGVRIAINGGTQKLSRVLIIFRGQVGETDGRVENSGHLVFHLLKIGVRRAIRLGKL